MEEDEVQDAMLAALRSRTMKGKGNTNMETFEALGDLLQLLQTANNNANTTSLRPALKHAAEALLKDFCLSGAGEDISSQPVFDRVEQCFAQVYLLADSRNMLQIAGELQDACKAQAKSAPLVSACLHALAGIAQHRGKALSGHLVDTLQICDAALTLSTSSGSANAAGASKFALFASAMTGSSSSSVAQPSADRQHLVMGAIRAAQNGLVGAGEAGKANWMLAIKFFTKCLAWKRSDEARVCTARALRAIADACPSFADKIAQLLAKHLLSAQGGNEQMEVATSFAWALTAGSSTERLWTLPAMDASSNAPKIKLDLLDTRSSLQDILDSVLAQFHSANGDAELRQALVQVFITLLHRSRVAAAASQEEVTAQAQWALQFAQTDVLCSAKALRMGIGAMLGERLQLALARFLLTTSEANSVSANVRAACGIELCHLIPTLSEASGSLLLEEMTRVQDAAVLRALCVSVPQLIPRCSNAWIDKLVNGLGDAGEVQRATSMLSSILFAAASVNRAGAVPTTNLFGLCKALASRTLEPGMEAFAVCGWKLLFALLSLGPGLFAPHLVQFLMLWTESLQEAATSAPKGSNDQALAASLFALVALLRNCDEKNLVVLQRSVSALLLPHKQAFVDAMSTRSANCQTAFFQVFSLLSQTKWMETTARDHVPLALFHLMTPNNASTSLLQPGGLLDACDDVLDDAESDDNARGEGQHEEEYMTSAALHALVGRRAIMRKSLAQRVKTAMQGGAYSEATLPNTDVRAVPTPARAALVDGAICVVATSFAFGPSKLKLQILASMQAKIGATQASLAKDMNIAATLLACIRLTTTNAHLGASEWHQPFFNLAWPLLKHGDARVRRAMAQALSQFTQRIAAMDMQQQVRAALEEALKDADVGGGALLCAVKLEREDMGNAILACCNKVMAVNPLWSLHCWTVFVNQTAQGKYVAPTLALATTSLFSDAPCPYALFGRLLVAMANCLNAEMMEPSRQRVVSTLISIWSWLKDRPEAKEPCILFLDRLYYFHSPQIKLQGSASHNPFAAFLFDSLQVSNGVFHAALPCYLRLCEEEIASTGGRAEYSIARVPIIFDALERFGRSFSAPGALAVIHPALGAAMPLRRAWQELEMGGSCAPTVPGNIKFFYPPDVEEDVCKTLSEIIRICSEETLLDFAAFLMCVVSNREIRWQTRLVALEGLGQVVLRTPTALLLPQLDALITCVCQISTLMVGDFDVSTVQTRGLACLSTIVTRFAGTMQEGAKGEPLLRQYEAQLNATLRPGLKNHIQAELSEEAGSLVAQLLLSSISTSAKRLISQLDEEEEGEVFVDDLSQVGFRLSRCTTFARLVIASWTGWDVDAKNDAQQQQQLRQDTLDRLRAAIPAQLVAKLCTFWLRITRDYFVLNSSRTLAAPKRHPDATYQSGRTSEDVEQLLPLYAQAWPLCALAAAHCLDSANWPIEFQGGKGAAVLIWGCTRAIALEEDPTKAIHTLEVLRKKKSWRAETDTAGIYAALLARARKAFSHRKFALRDVCMGCLEVFLAAASSASLAEREWALLFTQIGLCFPPQESKMSLLLRFHLVRNMPSALTVIFMTSAARQAVLGEGEEEIGVCSKVFNALLARTAAGNGSSSQQQDVQVTLQFVWDAMMSAAEAGEALPRFFCFWANVGASKLTEAKHLEMIKRLPCNKLVLQGLVELLKRDKQVAGAYYFDRLWDAVIIPASKEWLYSTDSFPLVCVAQILQAEAASPSALLDLFFADADKSQAPRKRIWLQFLNQLAQVNKPGFQAYLATAPVERKLALREYMM